MTRQAPQPPPPAYQPLARKYRPQTFQDLIGQPHVTATLTRALDAKRIAQAYLFAGQRGVGKTSAARILAKCLNCAKGPAATPCDACPSCEQIRRGNSLDVVEIDGASNRGIDEIRTLRETVPFAPASGHFRIYIIDEVHMLTTEAFNALLKTLEEPPAHVKFIFATTAPAKVPATILSRCQRFDFRRIDAATIVAVLARLAKAEHVAVDEAALYAVARASDGSLRDAEVVLDQLSSFAQGRIGEADVTELLGAVESSAMLAWVEAMLRGDALSALAEIARQAERGREPLSLLTGLMRHLRNLLVLRVTGEPGARQDGAPSLVDEPPDRLPALRTQAGQLAVQEWLLWLQVAHGAYELMRRSPMGQTLLELVVIKLASREAWQSLDEISRRLDALDRGAAPKADTPGHSAPASLPQPVPASPGHERAAPPPAVQEPAAATAGPPDGVRAIWPVFLERLGAQKMSLAAYLADAQPVGLDGGVLTVGLPAFALHQEVLGLSDNRRLIDRLMTELCRTAVSVQYTTLAAGAGTMAASAAQAPADTAPPLVQEIVNLFNATIITRPQSTT